MEASSVSSRMKIGCILALLLTLPAFAADCITICGGEEIYQIDPKASPLTKIWSWRARERPEIPESLKGTFATTDECKPLEGGKRLLVCSSSGGCALLEIPSGKAIWWARVANAHSIESLPGNGIAVASSVGSGGNKVVFFDSAVPEKPVAEIPLSSAHGLVWDDGRAGLWALGLKELIFLQKPKDGSSKGFQAVARHPLPDEDGHDLRPLPRSPDLLVSTQSHVWRFDRETGRFREDPDLKDRREAKSIDVHPETGTILITQAMGGNWWTNFVELLNPAGKLVLEQERIYKARWFLTAKP